MKINSKDFLVCPNCEGERFDELYKIHKPEIKGETVEVKTPTFVCENCNFELMDTDQMDLLRKATADQYRKNHDLLTSGEILEYRTKLSMNQLEFAIYLKVGAASIKRWETYYVQDEAQDELIRLKCDLSYAEENVQIVRRKSENSSSKYYLKWELFDFFNTPGSQKEIIQNLGQTEGSFVTVPNSSSTVVSFLKIPEDENLSGTLAVSNEEVQL